MCDQGRHNDYRKKAYYQNATIKGTVSRNKYCILSYEWCFRNCFYISKPSLKSCNFCNCRPLYAKPVYWYAGFCFKLHAILLCDTERQHTTVDVAPLRAFPVCDTPTLQSATRKRLSRHNAANPRRYRGQISVCVTIVEEGK